METKLQSKQQYPRFIQNKPCGIDKFDGGSQERLAKTIARHFCQNDSLDEECTLPRIIIKRTCNAALYWNCLQANLLMMVSYLEMQQ